MEFKKTRRVVTGHDTQGKAGCYSTATPFRNSGVQVAMRSLCCG